MATIEYTRQKKITFIALILIFKWLKVNDIISDKTDSDTQNMTNLTVSPYSKWHFSNLIGYRNFQKVFKLLTLD